MNNQKKNVIYAILVISIFLIALFFLGDSSFKTVTFSPLPSSQTAAVSGSGSGLVAHYTFDEGSGTTAGDSAGSYTGTIIDGVPWVSGGVIGGALNFTGSTQAVSVAGDPIGNGDSTITAWIKPSNIPFIGMIASNNSNGFSLSIMGNFKRLTCTDGGSGGGISAYSANDSITANVWQFVTAIRTSDGTCTMYVNGALSGGQNQNVGPVIAGNSGLYIGRRPAPAYPFAGLIDDVRIYNRPLSASEVMQIYTEGGGVPAPAYHTLTVLKTGSGSVSSSPSGISCDSTCSKSFVENTPITLTATPSTGSTFSGWSGGGCSGTGTCTIVLNAATSVTAPFVSDNPALVAGNDITAVDCSQVYVQQAIDLASDGMTVHIPAGNCEWSPTSSSGAAVYMNKAITLKGAGMGMTNITLTNTSGYNQEALVVNISADKVFRITGLTFHGDAEYAYILVYGSSKQFRIDHVSNVADSPHPPRIIAVSGNTYGVIDHIHAEVGSSGYGGEVLVRAEDSWANMNSNTAWKRPLTLGTNQAVYVEDSTFVGVRTGFSGFATDIENGGRMVFRHNVVTNIEFGGHGAQSSGGRGEFSWEVYDNVFNFDYSVWAVMTWLRGGTGVVFNNTYNHTGGAYGYYIALDNPRSHTAYGTFGSKCDGTNSWDGNQETNGYPCLDQLGRSTGDPQHQALEPAYFWNNTAGGTPVEPVVINPPSDVHIKKGRDYIVGTPRPGYVPYTYPHPLTLSGFTSDDPNSTYVPPVFSPAPLTPQIPLPPTQNACTSFTYSAWGMCSNNTQSRTILTSSPASCTGGVPVTTQTCTIAPVNALCSNTLNTCVAGTFSDTADTVANNMWSCLGSNQGTSLSCSLPKKVEADLLVEKPAVPDTVVQKPISTPNVIPVADVPPPASLISRFIPSFTSPTTPSTVTIPRKPIAPGTFVPLPEATPEDLASDTSSISIIETVKDILTYVIERIQRGIQRVVGIK